MGAGVEPREGQGARVHRWPVRGPMGERPRGRANPRLRDAPEPRRRVRPPPSRALTLRPAWVRAPCARPRPGSPLASCAFPARPRRAGLSSVPASSGSMQAAAASRAPLCGRLGPLQCAAKDTGPRAHSCPGVPGACRSRTASPRSGMGRVLSHPRRGRTRGRCPASRVPSERATASPARGGVALANSCQPGGLSRGVPELPTGSVPPPGVRSHR